MRWTARQLPEQSDRRVVVTGANAGLGFATARALARQGAHVILACRDAEKGERAAEEIRAQAPAGGAELGVLDLADLSSVKAFAEGLLQKEQGIDLLINNAGVMMPPFSKTVDGCELQFGVNYLGHFALTARLLPLLVATPNARVVTLSSIAHRRAKIDFDSFEGGTRYRPWRAYQQSKLACLIFAIELHRRLVAQGVALSSVAAHPGWTQTDLMRHQGAADFFTDHMAMPVDQGALPTLYAATADEARSGGYYGPDGLFEMRGYPAAAVVAKSARDPETAARLWEYSEHKTGLSLGSGGR